MQDIYIQNFVSFLFNFLSGASILGLGYALTQRSVHEYTRNKYAQEIKKELLKFRETVLINSNRLASLYYDEITFKSMSNFKKYELAEDFNLSTAKLTSRMELYLILSSELKEKIENILDKSINRYTEFHIAIRSKFDINDLDKSSKDFYASVIDLDEFIINSEVKTK